MKKELVLFIRFLVFMLVLSSCNKKAAERNRIEYEIEKIQSELPLKLGDSGVSMTNVFIDGDFVVCTCIIPSEIAEASGITDEVANSDRNIARLFSSLSDELIKSLEESGLGLKYVYLNSESGKKSFEVSADAERISSIRRKLEAGEIEPYSVLELTQMELNKMEFPSQLDEGLWLIDEYLDGSNLVSVAVFEEEIDKTIITKSLLKEMKSDIIAGLKNEYLLMSRKKELIKENIHFVYVFRDCRGIELCRVTISPDEL